MKVIQYTCRAHLIKSIRIIIIMDMMGLVIHAAFRSLLTVYYFYYFTSIECFKDGLVCWFMVFNATFNNILIISWQSVLLVEVTGENHRPVVSHW
jgi:hypothetical protein